MSQPLVSVIIPTYNRVSVLGRCIDSVLAQTYSNIEVIVVDDGSTDNTIEFINGLSDNRVRLIVQKVNSGVSVARNMGMEAAKGAYVAFQDSDDEWLPNKLSVQIAWMEQHLHIPMTFCGLVRANDTSLQVDCRPQVIPPANQDAFKKKLFSRNMMWTQTWVMRRNLVESGYRFSESILRVQDWDLALEISKSHRIGYVPQFLVLVHETEGSLMSLKKQYLIDLEQMWVKHQDLVSQYPDVGAEHARRLAYLCSHYKADEVTFWLRKAIKLTPFRLGTLLSFGGANLSVSLYRFMHRMKQ